MTKGGTDAEPNGATDGADPSAVDADAFDRARKRVAGRVHRTPLLSATRVGRQAGGIRLHLKAENLQKTGSFKVRGVLNKLAGLDREARAGGAVTVSAGNHAQALAWGSAEVDMDCKVVMPRSAPRSKVEACRDYGADVVLEEDVFRAFETARRLGEEEGRIFVHPFDDPDIVAGQGTVGLEILDDLEALDAVVVPVGGGGLAGGIAAAVGQERPGVGVYGVEPEGADAMRRSLDAGEPVRLDRVDTIADGLGSPMAGELTYPLLRRWADDVVLVSDDEIARTMARLLRYTKLLTEPAGAAGVAALLAGRIPLPEGATVAAVLSGGNVDLDRLKELI